MMEVNQMMGKNLATTLMMIFNLKLFYFQFYNILNYVNVVFIDFRYKVLCN